MNKIKSHTNAGLQNAAFKKQYIPPTINVTIFELEEGIATTSTQLQIGGNTGTPEVTDWVEKKDEQFWDF